MSSSTAKLTTSRRETRSSSLKKSLEQTESASKLPDTKIDIEHPQSEGKGSTSSGKELVFSSAKKSNSGNPDQLPKILLTSPHNESKILFSGGSSASRQSSYSLVMGEIKTPDSRIGKTKRWFNNDSLATMSINRVIMNHHGETRFTKTEPIKELMSKKDFAYSAENIIKRVKLNLASDSKSQTKIN
eukprot:TRINITY_DN20045_c0_g1_i2.p1 TRINITY_DN20045_c0_g1~~TRINITY_DN20045_c0_g1_i2.p1  ORF type:complete len:187 (-),score=39.58 TRINITY_DN20045_c0_g1_i2:198-758(-)